MHLYYILLLFNKALCDCILQLPLYQIDAKRFLTYQLFLWPKVFFGHRRSDLMIYHLFEMDPIFNIFAMSVLYYLFFI